MVRRLDKQKALQIHGQSPVSDHPNLTGGLLLKFGISNRKFWIKNLNENFERVREL